MKKLYLTFIITLVFSINVLAAAYNCASPIATATYVPGSGVAIINPDGVTCGYTNEDAVPGGNSSYACYKFAQHQYGPLVTALTGCTDYIPNGAPINASLIWLIFAGIGIGTFMIRKNSRPKQQPALANPNQAA